MKTINIQSLDTIQEAAKAFLEVVNKPAVVSFKAPMGSGKTTFIKAVCRELGVTENITSPTFAIINEYIGKTDEPIYHFDCYRIKDINEAYDIGFEDYFYSGSYCFVEWPDKIDQILPNKMVEVEIKVNEKGLRQVEIH